MDIKATDLLDFYASPLGQRSSEVLGQRIVSWWPDLSGQRMLTLGYGAMLESHLLPLTPLSLCHFIPARLSGIAGSTQTGTWKTLSMNEDADAISWKIDYTEKFNNADPDDAVNHNMMEMWVLEYFPPKVCYPVDPSKAKPVFVAWSTIKSLASALFIHESLRHGEGY